MKTIKTNRTIFEKILLKKPFNCNTWLFYLYIEINNRYFNYAKKILRRAMFCLKNRIHFAQKLHFFYTIVFSKVLNLNCFDTILNLDFYNKFFSKNLSLFLMMGKINQIIYLLKNKYKYNLNYKKILKLFDLETKLGKIENSIFLFESFYVDNKYSVSLRLFDNLCNRVFDLLNRKRKLVITKNSLFIFNKIKNKFYIAQLNYKILKKWKFNYIKQLDYIGNKFLFIKKPMSTILIIDFLHINYIKKKLRIVIQPRGYFELVKNSLFIVFSNMKYDIKLNPKLSSLIFLINIIIKDQFHLIKKFKITEIYKIFFFLKHTQFYINNLFWSLVAIKKLFIYLFFIFFDQRLYSYCYIFFNIRIFFYLKKKILNNKKKLLPSIHKFLNLKFWKKKNILKILFMKKIH
nr:hypothetical protein Cry52Nrm2_p112 [Cryptomonas curvata]